ncbi:helix-turn-helix transcriptional regulator [Halomarina salina]|uniref:Helix-turn-helix transcriptional regulator n=1 Tax=Halomarina salina TaxID=1872699 RepID=A0ABD5RNG9_9EURY|nr:hypothetical protein [Halomarina salina]
MSSPLSDLEFLARSENRVAVLAALREGAATRRDLRETLDVERVTLGRILADFEERSWAVDADGTYRLTVVGEIVADTLAEAVDAIESARTLEPLVGLLPFEEFDVEPTRFQGATVTEATVGDPYRPVRRFMELLDGSSSLRGYDTTTIAPLYVDDVRENVLGGMTTDVVYLPTVAEQLVEDYRDAVAAAVEAGHLRLRVDDSLPFGLAVFDDRVGVGVYDDANGMLSVFVDTDDPAVREWAVESFATHWSRATPLDAWAAESS